MALTLSRDCPHCGVQNTAFTYRGLAQKPKTDQFVTFFTCNYCGGALVVDCIPKTGRTANEWGTALGDFEEHAIFIEVYPTRSDRSVPTGVPDAVATACREANDCLRNNFHTAAALMYRRALELATIELGKRSGPLKSRIDSLADDGKITPQLRDWAHAIRLDGNEAAHEPEKIGTQAATALSDFTELFLQYTFTLPDMLARRSRAAQSPGQELSSP